MSHDQLIRHAVDAARAGNPALARVHLQKAAESAPDDPTVWLWLSWLADSPVSMVQCLELVKRHDTYRDIAESGLAFARALARFDCEAAVDSEASTRKLSGNNPADDEPLCEKLSEPVAASDVELVQETSELEEATIEPEEDPNATADAVEPLVNSDEAVTAKQESALNSGSSTDEAELDAEACEALMADLEEAAARALGPVRDDSPRTMEDEESLPEPPTSWDGIELLARTADAVADELKSDLITDDAEETLSFPAGELELPIESVPHNGAEDTAAVEADDQGEAAIHEVFADPPPTDEGSSWFDYWLPKEQRMSDSAPVSGEAVSDERDNIEEETVGADEREDEEESAPELENFVDSPSQDVPTKNAIQKSVAPVIDPEAPVLELVDAMPPFEDTSTNDPPDLPVETQCDAEAASEASTPGPPPIPVEAEPASPKPIPVREPVNAWRAARTDWFSAASNALVPHEATDAAPTVLPPFATAAATNPAISSPAPSETSAPRPANRSMFDAEPTPPALIDSVGSAPVVSPDAAANFGPAPGGTVIGMVNSGGSNLEDSESTSGTDTPQTGTSDDTAGRSQQKLDTSTRRTILVVDDSPTVRKLVEMSLTRSGFRVVHAFDGVAAIKEIARQNPSLILMDVNMPRLDGYQLCKLVKKHETTRHIPVVMLAGKEGVFDKLRGKLVGCSGYIAKPFSPEELVAAVERFLSAPAAI